MNESNGKIIDVIESKGMAAGQQVHLPDPLAAPLAVGMGSYHLMTTIQAGHDLLLQYLCTNVGTMCVPDVCWVDLLLNTAGECLASNANGCRGSYSQMHSPFPELY